MRVFRDDSGTEWTAWEVRPGQVVVGAGEQRTGRDRRVAPAPDPVIERRRQEERRVRARPSVAYFGHELADGWLTFQAQGTRRRLAPVPDGWDELADADLAALCGRAVDAARPGRSAGARPTDLDLVGSRG
jgi:hypothetical protein